MTMRETDKLAFERVQQRNSTKSDDGGDYETKTEEPTCKCRSEL